MKTYDLKQNNGRKSFYGKAFVLIDDSGNEILYSYRTPVVKRMASEKLVRLYDGRTATTGRHISAFCGLNKSGFLNLPLGG